MFRFLKATIIVIILSTCVTIIGLHIEEKFDSRPFKFEEYRTKESFEEALKNNFPIDSNVEDALEVLTASNAECKVYDHRGDESWINKHKYAFLLSCEYFTGWVSLYPLEFYRLYIDADINLKVVDIWAGRTKGIVI